MSILHTPQLIYHITNYTRWYRKLIWRCVFKKNSGLTISLVKSRRGILFKSEHFLKSQPPQCASFLTDNRADLKPKPAFDRQNVCQIRLVTINAHLNWIWQKAKFGNCILHKRSTAIKTSRPFPFRKRPINLYPLLKENYCVGRWGHWSRI